MNEFEQWLLTEAGQRCLTWPVDGPEFLRNRLWWAFNAGRDSYAESSQFANSERAASPTTARQEP